MTAYETFPSDSPLLDGFPPGQRENARMMFENQLNHMNHSDAPCGLPYNVRATNKHAIGDFAISPKEGECPLGDGVYCRKPMEFIYTGSSSKEEPAECPHMMHERTTGWFEAEVCCSLKHEKAKV